MTADNQAKEDLTGLSVRLRILATSDLHMQLTAFDYLKAKKTQGGSLARLATLIEAAREDAKAKGEVCILVDNGDTWQGNALADHLACHMNGAPHPMSRAIQLLDYDALGIGNHDFDFGTDYLAECLAQTGATAICSNMQGLDLPYIQEAALLEKDIVGRNGRTETLRIGVLATTPDLTNIWNRHHLAGKIWFSRPLPSVSAGAMKLRAQGADVVLVLAHMGFELFGETAHSQNELDDMAALQGVDAVVGGHTHQRFPEQGLKSVNRNHAPTGLVHDTPVVQPGASGSDLGQIHLTLQRSSTTSNWEVTRASSELVRVAANTLEHPDVVQAAQKAHTETCTFLDRPAAKIANPMNTFFALAQPSPVQALLAAAKRKMISEAVAGTELERLPLVSAASATLTGGYDGPDNFISLKGGEIKHRHIAGMNPYANQVWAVRSTGERLLDWLERSAVIFNTLSRKRPEQLLINPDIPGFRYDVIFGLSYEINPRRKPRFDEGGKRIPNRVGRVSNVTWQGQPLDPDQEFLVATTDHRAGGGGIYQPFASDDILLRGHVPLKTALLNYLENPSCDEVRSAKPWRLKPDMALSAILLTAPDAVHHFEDIAHYNPENCGLSDEGFLRVRLTL